MPWRVFPWDPAAKPGEPFSSSYIYPNQGSGRFDLRDPAVPVLYLAETAVHAIAEKLQRFRGQRLDRHDLKESGRALALVECKIPSMAKIVDLCDPAVLVKHAIRPDVLASRDFRNTQTMARALHQQGYRGLRWWSALSGDWHTIVLFMDRIGGSDIEYGKPEVITLTHPLVKEATA